MSIKVAVVCASNQNRSMEGHYVLGKREGLQVYSYGTNKEVKIPGPSMDRPNIYPFGTPYEHIYQDLLLKDAQLYTQNGLLQMLERNRKIKSYPERFQESEEKFDIIFTCEERCYDIVCEELISRSGTENRPVFVVNFEMKDNLEEAAIGARSMLQFVDCILATGAADDLESQFEEIIEKFQQKCSTSPSSSSISTLHTVCFY